MKLQDEKTSISQLSLEEAIAINRKIRQARLTPLPVAKKKAPKEKKPKSLISKALANDKAKLQELLDILEKK